MIETMNLKELERKAFRATFQDGLWDIYLGMIVIWMGIFIYHPEEGYGPRNLILLAVGFAISYLLFWAGKRYLTVPRLGQVTFGPIRKQKRTTLAIILGIVVLVQGGIVLLSIGGWANPTLGEKILALLPGGSIELLVVAAVGALFIGPSMIVVAYFNDFLRGYYIAIVMSLAVFLMIYLNQPIYAAALGGLIVLPGVVLLVRFLQKHPLRRGSEN